MNATPDDADRIATHAKAVLPLATASLGDEYYYASVPLCVIDAVFSISVQYEGVRAVVGRYCARFGLPRTRQDRMTLPPRDQQESVTTFCARFESLGLEAMTEAFGSRQRTSPRGGILKAEAVGRFAAALRAHGVEHLQDVPAAGNDEALERAVRSIPGQRSGVSLRYFWMLAGSDDFIKPDRMVLRFLHAALGRQVATEEVQKFLVAAVERLKPKHPHLTPRLMDYAVWAHQRQVAGGSPPPGREGVATSSAQTPVASDRLAAVIKTLAAEKRAHLDQMQAEYSELARPDFLWHFLLQSFSTMGRAAGWHGLIATKANYDRVTYEALATLNPDERAAQVAAVCKAAKVRMPQLKAEYILGCFEKVRALGGSEVAKAQLLAQSGREGKVRFLKTFPGVGDKYARNMMMDVYHDDFRDSIAIDARIKAISKALGLSFKNYAEHEAFYLDVGRQAGVNGWELDRLLFNYRTEVEAALAATVTPPGASPSCAGGVGPSASPAGPGEP